MTKVPNANSHHAIGPIRRGLAGFALVLLLSPGPESAAGQDPDEGLWDLHPEQRWQVSEGLRIGEGRGEGPAAFGFAQCLAVDPMDRIWVTDGFTHEIRVFDADGSFVRSVRKLNEGAGEFQIIGEAFPGPGDRIWVEERSLRRYQIFDTAGTWVGSQEFVFPQAPGETRAWTRQGLMVAREAFEEDVDTVRFYELADGALRATAPRTTWPAQRMATHVVTVGAPEGQLSVSFLEAIPFATQPRSFSAPTWTSGRLGRSVPMATRFAGQAWKPATTCWRSHGATTGRNSRLQTQGSGGLAGRAAHEHRKQGALRNPLEKAAASLRRLREHPCGGRRGGMGAPYARRGSTRFRRLCTRRPVSGTADRTGGSGRGEDTGHQGKQHLRRQDRRRRARRRPQVRCCGNG